MANQATFFLDSVVCRDETGGRWREMVGNDEIYMGAIGVDANGTPQKVPFFEVYAHFDDGDVKNYSPARSLATLALNGGSNGRMILFLAEKQHGGMNAALDKAFGDASLALARAKADGQSPQESVFWEVVIETAKEVGRWLLKESKDKVFPPIVVGLQPNVGVVQFAGFDGLYAARYHWSLG